MPSTDWRNDENYAYTKNHDDAHWAWEFLRRDPEYRADWERELTAGLARTNKWRSDARLPILSVEHPHFILRMDGPEYERKWWLYHLLNPVTQKPLPLHGRWSIGRGLSFHLGGGPGIFEGLPEKQTVGVPDGHMVVVFDLGRKLTPQLSAAKAALEPWQRRWLRETGTAKPASKQRTAYSSFARYLQVVDADGAGASKADIAEHCHGINSEDAAKEALKQARYWINNYRSLLVP